MPLKCSKTSFSSLLRDIKPEVRCCVGLTLTVYISRASIAKCTKSMYIHNISGENSFSCVLESEPYIENH